jgi:hypothetical protein
MGMKLKSLTLREKHRLRVFETRVLKVFEQKMDEVAGRLRKGILRNFITYSLQSKIGIIKSKRMRRAGYVA